MRRVLSLWLLLAILFGRLTPPARAADPDVVSPLASYVYLDTLAALPLQENIVSPLVSFLYLDSLTSPPSQPNVVSPLVSYLYQDSLAASPGQPNVVSPLVSFIYYDWPGDENLTFQNSPLVSYFFRDNAALTLAGPVVVNAGANASYRAFLGAQDVTVGALFSFAQPTPSYAGIGGATLFISANAPIGTLLLRAAYNDPAGQFVSAPVAISVVRGFSASATVTVQRLSGNIFQFSLAGSAASGTGPFTFRWDTNGDGSYGEVVGQTASFSLNSTGGEQRIGLEVTDAANVKAYATRYVTLDKMPVANEPVRTKPKGDVGVGQVYDQDGHLFQFRSDRTPNGLVVITHGLYASGLDVWPRDMAQRVETRLTADRQGRVPNIMVFDWGEDSDPSGQINPYALAALEIAGTVKDGLGLWNAAKTGPEAFASSARKQAIKKGVDTVFSDYVPSPANYAKWTDMAIDAYYVRDIAVAHGQTLGSFLWLQANAGLIDVDEPIHLIGHSAGGFCVGESALWLKQHPLPNGKVVTVDRVTMLDTPYMWLPHLSVLPNPTVVEQIVSSVFGALEFPETQKISPGTYYRYKMLDGTAARDTVGWRWDLNGHELSHRWYARTISPESEADGATLDNYGMDGFSLSPFLNGPMAPRGAGGFAASKLKAGGEALALQNLTGFSTFGGVTQTGASYTITEQANAGIFKTLAVPIGAQKLTFRFRFVSAGDGDFLSVRFGDDADLYIGLDNELSRRELTTVEVPLNGLDGVTADLVFALISRGASNAVVEIADIAMVTDDDPDADSLTTSVELAQGTDQLRYDTDDDGWGDFYELNTTGTNPTVADTDGDGQNDAAEAAAGTDPLDNKSVFAVRDTTKTTGSFTLRWSAKAGKTYRVQRSTNADFASYDVISTPIAGVEPLATYTDGTFELLNSPVVFYRIVTEP